MRITVSKLKVILKQLPEASKFHSNVYLAKVYSESELKEWPLMEQEYVKFFKTHTNTGYDWVITI